MKNDHHHGTLYIVGLGPGAPGLLTPDAAAALGAAQAVVGYSGYLDLIEPRLAGKEVIRRALGEEEQRAREALELAQAGRTVALVSSGDAGVYGMAGVAWELAARNGSDAEIVVIPGVTAAVAAAALLGAPLADDWVSISLSDLHVPWELIRRRVRAAAEADFVVVFYNPASRKRTWQLREAAQTLLEYRGPHTPVGLVENAYRPEQRVEAIPLDQLASARVSMFTTVVVGNSRTLAAPRGMVTTRAWPNGEVSGAEEPGPRQDSKRRPDPILTESLTIVERKLGPDPSDPAERAVVKRMIHATADFDFASSVRFGPGAIAASVAAFRNRRPVVVDVEMLRAGVRSDLAGELGVQVVCGLNDRASRALAEAEGITRSAAGVRQAANTVDEGAVVAIGNAPTALVEVLRLIEHEGWRPACVVGIPVGFVGVDEAKERLAGQSVVPYITNVGPKGGTSATAAAVNALLELAAKGP
jgi:precorrin-3B C17-methyltransferase